MGAERVSKMTDWFTNNYRHTLLKNKNWQTILEHGSEEKAAAL